LPLLLLFIVTYLRGGKVGKAGGKVEKSEGDEEELPAEVCFSLACFLLPAVSFSLLLLQFHTQIHPANISISISFACCLEGENSEQGGLLLHCPLW